MKAWVFNDRNEVWHYHNNEIRYRPISRVASDDYFYEVKPINDDELKYFKLFFLRKLPKDAQAEALRDVGVLQRTTEAEKRLDVIMDIASQAFGGYENIPDELAKEHVKLKKAANILPKNIVEDYLGSTEQKAIKWLDSLKKGCSDFFLKDKPLSTVDDCLTNERYRFLLFFCEQYCRTKATR